MRSRRRPRSQAGEEDRPQTAADAEDEAEAAADEAPGPQQPADEGPEPQQPADAAPETQQPADEASHSRRLRRPRRPHARTAGQGRVRAAAVRLARRRVSRRAIIVAMIALPLLGAAIGAGTHAQPAVRYVGEATIFVQGQAGRGTSKRLGRLVARGAELPEVLTAARKMMASPLSTQELAERSDGVFLPEVALVRIRARDQDRNRALSTANAIGIQALNYARRVASSRGGATVVGDFEEPQTEWGATQSLFNTAPRRLERVPSGMFGSASLRASCPGTPTCGPTVRLSQYFERGVTYLAEGWARADGRASVEMVLGGASDDVSTGTPTALGQGWRKLTVAWAPAADRTSAELGFRMSSSDRAAFQIDGVRLLGTVSESARGFPASRPAARRLAFEDARFATLSPARPARAAGGRNRTLGWALIGSLGGAGVALVALACGAAARRVEHRRRSADGLESSPTSVARPTVNGLAE